MTYEQVYELNKRMQSIFSMERTEYNLERYVMSELLSPIEDFYSVIDLVKTNNDIIQKFNLYYVAAYLAADWKIEDTYFLSKLNKEIAGASENDKAIIYYLNAKYISRKGSSKEYKSYLQKSVDCSKNMKFVNNKYDLACISCGKNIKKLMNEAFGDIEVIDTQVCLKNKPTEYWLDIHRWIREFILGTEITDVQMDKFEKIKALPVQS